ncbi:MAG: hypothetical protein KF830_13050 [Planctomycetes bacterium]|nr:hypothetical protein [Planctomycetota bacterium]
MAALAEQEPQLDGAGAGAGPLTRRAARPLLAAVLFAALLAGQQPATSALVARLAAPNVTLDEARDVVGQVQGRPLAARTALFDALQKANAEQRQQFQRQRERLLQRFTKAVPATQQDQLGRGGEARLEAARKAARAITARADLDKARIQTELDPLLAELRAMVLPGPEPVFAREPELAREAASLRQRAAELEAWFDLCLEAAHQLDLEPEGRRHLERVGLPAWPAAADDLDTELGRACLFGLPLGAGDRRTLEANEALRAGMDPAEYAGTLELNRIRLALGLNALRIDEKLGNAARDHSRDMHTLGFFSHDSPVQGKRTFGDRAARAGTSASSENIAAGHSRGEGAIEAWWYSPGHHKNMLGNHARTGLGRWEQTWTQLFGS